MTGMINVDYMAIDWVLRTKQEQFTTVSAPGFYGEEKIEYIKSYPEWLLLFKNEYLKYAEDVYEKPECKIAELNNKTMFLIGIYINDDPIEFIKLDFDSDTFTYVDEWRNEDIREYSLGNFFTEFIKIHPSIQIPEIRETIV